MVFGGNEKNGQTKGVGEIHKNGLSIEDVSFIDGLKSNLQSTSQFCGKGYYVEFSKYKCLVRNEATKELVLIRVRKKSMYVVD